MKRKIAKNGHSSLLKCEYDKKSMNWIIYNNI